MRRGRVGVPIFVSQGRHDRQTDFELARAYVDAPGAPHKEFVVFEDASHLLPFERPGEFLDVRVRRVRPWAPGHERSDGN